MFKTLMKRRKLLATAGGLIGSSALVLGVAVPADATPAPAQNTLIIQGGSNTTYGMMLGLSNLFDQAIGCNPLTTGSTQPLDYSCSTTPQTGGENGYPVGPTQTAPFNYNQVNPYNDVVAQEPPLGSSNGINAIQDNGTAGSGINAAPIAAARSSRAAKSGDDGSEFVAYAEDAVPWFGFSAVPVSVNSGVSCTKNITSISDAELTAIYTETSPTTWGQVATASGTVLSGSMPSTCTSEDVDCYMAQNGSGTESTWQTDLSTGSATPTCLSNEQVGSASNHVIFENEDSAIIGNPAGDDAGQALFYFSFGKFNTLCPAGKGACAVHTGFVGKVGEIDGVAANQCTIQDTGLSLKGKGAKAKCKGTPTKFFTDRELFNVYENCGPNNTNAVSCNGDDQAEQAMLNFDSSIGFICNPTTYADHDPLSPTNETYGQEIDAVITSNGFYAFPLGVQGDTGGAAVAPWTSATSSTEAQITQDTVTNWGATSSTNPYYLADVAPSTSPANNGDKGYCRVTEGT